MRGPRRVAFAAILACSFVSPIATPVAAVEPDDLPWDEIDRVLKEQPATPGSGSNRAGPGRSGDDTDVQGDDRDDHNRANAPSNSSTQIDNDRLDPERRPATTPAPSDAPQMTARPEPSPIAPVQAPVQAPSPAATHAMTSPAPVTPPPAATPEPNTQPSPAAPQAQPPPIMPAQAPALAVPSAPAEQATAAPAPVGGHLNLPLKRYFDTKAVVTLKEFDEADRTALAQFYAARMDQALWVTKDGFNAAATGLIGEIRQADDWGLSSADYKVPALARIGSGEFPDDDLAEAEVKLSLVAMEYARHARGDRIDDPATELSSYLDRKPQLIDRPKLLEALASAAEPGGYLRSLHPKHVQFERLRQKLLALRAGKPEEEFEKIPDGPKITAGKTHWQVALVRRRLKVAVPGVKPDGTAADENFYDTDLARAVESFKEKNAIQPVNPAITTALRSALNKQDRISEEAVLVNMEQWRWMPEDLGPTHIEVNIPEFLVRVVKNGQIIHEERIVAGKNETQTPIFSNLMRTVVFQPPWNVPESIKVNELLPKLRDGGNPIERQGLVMQRNGHPVDVWDVDWSTADIRQYNIYQPPGDANVLGIVKFLFPNKHSVYLHDTPSKNLFNEKVRTFSHGCMRVRNPVQLAEVIMSEDKGWDKARVNELITTGPEDNNITLDKPLPVHVMYFTAWVDDSGGLKTFADVYGHEQRIKLGLEGRWGEIVKNRDHLLPAEDVPVASNREDWGDSDDPPVRRFRQQPRFTYREPPLPPGKYPKQYRNTESEFGKFMRNILGNN